MKDYDAQFWKNEYERLRRNRKKEIEQLRYQTAVFTKKTWELLHLLGMKDKEIMEYYGSAEGNQKQDYLSRRLS